MSVTVVMPTIGRVPLSRALKSVIAQTYQVLEVLIVDSSDSGIPETETNLSPLIRVIRNNGDSQGGAKPVWTAAHNRNIGILQARGAYIALIDDDDEWLPEKLAIQMEAIGERTDVISSTSVSYRLPNGKSLVRPRILLRNEHSFLNCVYSRPRWRRSDFYIATPTVIVPTEVAKRVLFDESLSWYEDTWWYHALELEGLKHEQLEFQLLVVYADPERSISRDSLYKNLEWAKRLASVNQKFGSNYLCGISLRNALWLGRWSHLIPLVYHGIKMRLKRQNKKK
jgi:glycosyltransferase involved in cell wall biosynthesis